MALPVPPAFPVTLLRAASCVAVQPSPDVGSFDIWLHGAHLSFPHLSMLRTSQLNRDESVSDSRKSNNLRKCLFYRCGSTPHAYTAQTNGFKERIP